MQALIQALADAQPTREQVEALERHMVTLPQLDIPVVHRYADGLYCREVTFPADSLSTGRVHRFEHVSIMLTGSMTMQMADGMRLVHAPQVFIAPPGTKRVGYAHTDVRWITVHTNPDNCHDVEAIEIRIVEPYAFAELLAQTLRATEVSS